MLQDKEKFQKYIDSISQTNGNNKRRRFKIPEGLESIFSEPYSPPNEELVRNEIKALLEEYDKFDLSEYVDLYYKKTYAVFQLQISFGQVHGPEKKSNVRISEDAQSNVKFILVQTALDAELDPLVSFLSYEQLQIKMDLHYLETQ